MELVGNLKDKDKMAEDQDEAKEILEEAGMLLTDEENDKVLRG